MSDSGPTHVKSQRYDPNGFRSSLAQILAAVGFSIYAINVGFIMGMPTIVIGALRQDGSPLQLSEDQASWFGSLAYIVQPVCSLGSGFLQEWLGRKLCLMLVNVPQLAAWTLLSFSSSAAHLYISVALLGLALGLMEAPTLSYIGEVSQPRFRGIFSTFMAIFFNFGLMIQSFLGALVPWRTMVLCNILGPVISLTLMALLPDSPAWLVSKGRIKEAERAYQWLRGWVPPEFVAEELNNMVVYVRDHRPVSSLPDGNSAKPEYRGKFHNVYALMTEPATSAALRLILCTFVVASSVSLLGLKPFLIEILDGLRLPIPSRNVVAIGGVLTMLGSITMALSMRFLGKRVIGLLSLALCIFCCFGIGLYLSTGVYFPWIPVVLFSLSYFSSQLGIYLLPWILCMELFPLRARSMGSGFCAAFAYVFNFIVTKTYYNLEAWLDVSGTCFLYGVIGVLGFVYLYLDLPETEGLALEEVERRLKEKRFVKKPHSRGSENKAFERH